MYEGHIGLCLKALTDPAAKVARAAARELCRQAQQQDTYRVQALLAGYEKIRTALPLCCGRRPRLPAPLCAAPVLTAFSPIPQRESCARRKPPAAP